MRVRRITYIRTFIPAQDVVSEDEPELCVQLCSRGFLLERPSLDNEILITASAQHF